jgi:hypothetical protein
MEEGLYFNDSQRDHRCVLGKPARGCAYKSTSRCFN